MTCSDIVNNLVAQFGSQRGFSERNVRRWCAEQGLVNKDLCPESHLEAVVAQGIVEVGDLSVSVQALVKPNLPLQNGPSFGRKLMTGFLATKGVKASEGRVGKVLRKMHPPYHAEHESSSRNLNPVPYNADYLGHKIHVDQNEKLVMFGVTHVMAIDIYSKKVVGHCTMPIKNNVTIYEEVYRPAVIRYGMWDQVRVDCGREFYLTLYVQEKMAAYRHNENRLPYLQTPSTRNHVIERMWVEINDRVNYPIKTALVQMTDQEELDMEDNLTKFCVSTLSLQVARIGMQNVVESWNAHRIPGVTLNSSGIGRASQTTSVGKGVHQVAEHLLPLCNVAADLYEQEVGGGATLRWESPFATDPFPSVESRQWAEGHFASQFNMRSLHQHVVTRDYTHFQSALRCLINITRHAVM
ncbi:hypothetical protein N1851_023290 [Merluccius polli]|uniref:Integrase core domain-containing protein n=1 Tax=Merluccius polli TaxID=89951 RepID=A0AA47NV63_MERPO|nr:hypothetical protein N1851_023290 [Merluccius polli]